ncbi:hypothetical protein AVEN_149462-1 [Araneus ventricosus]|uniref:Uncharacterized protein n=1 Tax=Araneus ventricosus TaxID=182803 RepID=A0A4Y2JN29_ARAVE|nr:hypothetical protein AVEN_149462-1 [Araneus ventricosus]
MHILGAHLASGNLASPPLPKNNQGSAITSPKKNPGTLQKMWEVGRCTEIAFSARGKGRESPVGVPWRRQRLNTATIDLSQKKVSKTPPEMRLQLPCPGSPGSINFHPREVQIVSDGGRRARLAQIALFRDIWRRRTPRPSDIQISNSHFLIRALRPL